MLALAGLPTQLKRFSKGRPGKELSDANIQSLSGNLKSFWLMTFWDKLKNLKMSYKTRHFQYTYTTEAKIIKDSQSTKNCWNCKAVHTRKNIAMLGPIFFEIPEKLTLSITNVWGILQTKRGSKNLTKSQLIDEDNIH